MSVQDGRRISSRLRPAISQTAYKVRQQVSRFDNAEVRKARILARLARKDALDIVLFGDSLASFVAPYDSDKRPLHQMVKDAFAPEAAVHAIHGGSYNPSIYNQFIRVLEGGPARPLVILPLTARVRTLPWIVHPAHGHQRATSFLETLDARAPLRKIRKGLAPPTTEDFAQFYAMEFPTWAGDLTIGDYVHGVKRGSLGEVETARLLYAYHHGGEIVRGAPLDTVREVGDRLRRLGIPVIVYQDPIPVEKGVELHGPQFQELAERNLEILEKAFVSGYGDVEVLRTGLTVPTAHFIDWRDGSEHVNEHGRATIVNALTGAAKALHRH